VSSTERYSDTGVPGQSQMCTKLQKDVVRIDDTWLCTKFVDSG
jgi:hypothetical protein